MNETKSTELPRRVLNRGICSGFTLVELLVVIGIIALLISLLLPSLNRARQASQRTACAAKIQQILLAASIHSIDHKGYWPLAGYLYGDGGYIAPANLSDTYTSHYSYMGYKQFGDSANGDTRCLAAINYALGYEMGYKNTMLVYDNTTPNALIASERARLEQHFLCPAQAATQGDIHYISWIYAGSVNSGLSTGTLCQISYVFNEAVLGFNDSFGRLRAQASRVRQPSKTFFVADGQSGSTTSRTSGGWLPGDSVLYPTQQYPAPWGTCTIYNNQTAGQYNNPITLGDALAGNTNPKNHGKLAGDPQNFDPIRHSMKMNIGFCDGHVESRPIPNLTRDPTASGLSDVYLIQP